MPLKKVLIAASLFLYTASAVSAGVMYVYQFSGTTVDGLQEAFQYTSSSLITTVTEIPTGSLDSCTRCLYGPTAYIFFNPELNPYYDQINLNDQNLTSYSYQFPFGSIGSLGTHDLCILDRALTLAL
jgi:hypothetical protein